MKKKILFSIIILISSIIVLFNKLFTPLPIQIVLETGQEISTQNSQYFSLIETILLIICSFLIGGSATYLYYNSEKLVVSPEEFVVKVSQHSSVDGKNSDQKDLGERREEKYSTILPLLGGDERRLVSLLMESKGEMLQNQLVLRLNLSKVKVTRILASLEQKALILKERNGLTNNIKLVL